MQKKWKKIPVEEFTSPSPLTVSENENLEGIRKLMRDNGIRHIPVVRGKELVGIISDRDVKLATTFNQSTTLKASDIMTPDPYTVSPETSLDEVAFEMSAHKYGCAIVQDEQGEVVGVFTSTDALNAIIEIVRGEV